MLYKRRINRFRTVQYDYTDGHLVKTVAKLAIDLPGRAFRGPMAQYKCKACADYFDKTCGLDGKPTPKKACAAMTRQTCGNCGKYRNCSHEKKNKKTVFRCKNYGVIVHIEEQK